MKTADCRKNGCPELRTYREKNATRLSVQDRINMLDLVACQRVLTLISKGVEFDIALKSEQAKKERTAKETPGQTVLE